MSKTIIEQPNSVSGAFDELLNKMYISNVQNRLRQLNEPTENDSKRWIWELIQNAKDSIVQDPLKKSVDMKVSIRDKEVIIKHNGSPFTAKAQLGLLYKYSAGKSNSSESTGRFGTGFLTTHVLSKIVSIEGDVFVDESNTDLCGFSATMYRDGLGEDELLDGVIKMKDSIEYTKETNNWTTYTYHLRTPQNEKALQLGIENIFDNIAQTMLFCKELKTFEIDNNGEVTSIERLPFSNLEDDIFKTKFIIRGNQTYSREFIHTSCKKPNDKLTERFKTDRNVRLIIAIEVDDKKNLINNEKSPSHFCVLPLVGSEKHIMPVYLNSPDFEPDSERESLILIGEEILSDKKVISEGGINRLILSESIELYDKLVSFLCEKKYNNLFLLSKGLKNSPRFEKNFNKDWFIEEIIKPYREIIKTYDIVETTIGHSKLFYENGEPNILIPSAIEEETRSEIYNLTEDLFPDRIPSNQTAREWSNLVWKECGLFKVEDLSKYISQKENLTQIPIHQDKIFDWMNVFISFINKKDDSLFTEYSLIPNMNDDLISLADEEIAEGVGLSKFMIDCLCDLGDDLRPILINHKITTLSIPLKIDAKSVANRISEQVNLILKNNGLNSEKKIEQLLPLIKILPSNIDSYTNEFIVKQKEINTYVGIFFPDLDSSPITNNDIPQKAWREIHNWLIELLMKKVEAYGNVNTLPETIINKIEFVNNFLDFVTNYIKEGELDEIAIIPNQNLDFCYKNTLSKDVDIPEEIKSPQAEDFGIILKKDLLHNGITSISISKEANINTVVELISNLFSTSNFGGKDSLDFAIFLTHFIPTESNQSLFNTQSQLLKIVREFYYSKSEPYSPVEINCSSESLWRTANKEINSTLVTHIEEEKNVIQVQNSLSKSGKEYDFGDTIIFLNSVYDYLSISNPQINGEIIPNQNGNFCSLDSEFYKDDNIPEILKDILVLLNKEKDFKNILVESSLTENAFPKHSKTTKDIASIIDSEIADLYSNPSNWEKENFIQAIEKLMITWFPKNRHLVKDYYPKIYRKKDTIEMNVLWSLEDRQRMQKVKKISPEILDKIINDALEIDSLEKEKQKLKEEIENLKEESSSIPLTTIFNEIQKEFPDLTADKIRTLLKLEERIKSWDGDYDYEPNTQEEEKRNFINGYKGEAYVYKQFKKSGLFKDVRWEHKSENETNLSIVDFEGEKHFIKENYSKYDLTAKTNDDELYFIEVKSTRTTLYDANTIALPISQGEWKFVEKIENNENYCLARVFEVENNPEGHYLIMKGIGASNLKK